MTGVLSPDKIEHFAAKLNEHFQMHPSRSSLPLTVLPAALSQGATQADCLAICKAAKQFGLHVNYWGSEQQFIRISAH